MNEAIVEKPLASFCVKSYNQKKHLIEALKGAFAQTYRPLEIVISDDGSTDGSWEYIQQAVEEFKKSHDDVPVIINHNSPNLGNLGNWQKCCELAHGELLVKADGDDISFPERTEEVMAFWVRDAKRAKIVSCGGIQIDPNGKELGRVEGKELFGAFCAYAKDLFLEFPYAVRFPRALDDTLYVARARMFGNVIIHVPKVLVKYRIGTGVSSALFDVRVPFERCVPLIVPAIRQGFIDVRYLKSLGHYVPEDLPRALTKDLRQHYDSAVLAGGAFSARILAFSRIQKENPCRCYTPLYFQRLCFLLPRRIGDVFLYFYTIPNYVRKIVLSWIRRNVC